MVVQVKNIIKKKKEKKRCILYTCKLEVCF